MESESLNEMMKFACDALVAIREQVTEANMHLGAMAEALIELSANCYEEVEEDDQAQKACEDQKEADKALQSAAAFDACG